MPTYRIPFGVVTLPEGDFFDTEARIDRRPAGRERFGGQACRPQPRVSIAGAR